MSVELGQILWLKIRFNNSGDISPTVHPYLILFKDSDLNYIEVGQLDSLKGKEYKATFRCNHPIYCSNPTEFVLLKDSFLQMDNEFRLENYPGLCRFRLTDEKLSIAKFNEARDAYMAYHNNYTIDNNKSVYLTKEEIEFLNK